MEITKDGFYDMAEEDYHADPCVEPSLSSGLANALLEETEEEAMLNQRRLNPDYEAKKSDVMDLGNMAHSLILEGDLSNFVVCPEYSDWRKNEAKEKKAAIEAEGKVALNASTASKLDDVRAMEKALRKQISEHREYSGILQNGKPEQAGFAKDGDIWLRARFDWIEDEYECPLGLYDALVVDYKTTGLTFEQWEKNELWKCKYIQEPHYRRVSNLITGKKTKFIFVVQRTVFPFHVQIFEIDRSYEDEVQSRYKVAQMIFKNCLKNDQWRGRPPYSAHSYPPPWILQKWDMDKANARNVESAEKKLEENPANVLAAG